MPCLLLQKLLELAATSIRLKHPSSCKITRTSGERLLALHLEQLLRPSADQPCPGIALFSVLIVFNEWVPPSTAFRQEHAAISSLPIIFPPISTACNGIRKLSHGDDALNHTIVIISTALLPSQICRLLPRNNRLLAAASIPAAAFHDLLASSRELCCSIECADNITVYVERKAA